MERTLLLNATYEPLMVIDWKRAISLVFLGKSDVLAEHETRVRSVSLTLRIPSVLRLRKRVRRVKPVIRFSRRNVYARDDYRCQYCAESFPAGKLTFDHVLPRSRGGKTSWTNIVACCEDCNRRKGDRTPAEAGMQLLKKPARPRHLPEIEHQFGGSNPPDDWQFYLWRKA